ncbi:MAG: putative Ig domain-containing protein, partial [Planctomycetota bacterium]|nr:putative Ig domain-containing protein [Planctomycetota bacterium]
IRLFSKDSAHAPKLHLHYASAPAKNPDMAAASTLKPVGTRPNLKFEIYAANLNRGAVGLAYKAALRARGGIAPYAWKAEGLPEGLSMSPAGELAGTPGKAGTYTLEVAATGADGKAATAKLDLVIGAPENAAAVVAGGAAKAPDAQKKQEEKKSGALEDE